MRLEYGQMFDHPVHTLLVTTNSFVRNDATLVMGRGAAREALKHFDNLDWHFGSLLLDRRPSGQQPRGVQADYGLLVNEKGAAAPWAVFSPVFYAEAARRTGYTGRKDWVKPGIFQVKRDWGKPALLDLIAESSEMLRRYALARPGELISLNFPGIGNGQLERDAVMPIVEQLPDNVILWQAVRPSGQCSQYGKSAARF